MKNEIQKQSASLIGYQCLERVFCTIIPFDLFSISWWCCCCVCVFRRFMHQTSAFFRLFSMFQEFDDFLLLSQKPVHAFNVLEMQMLGVDLAYRQVTSNRSGNVATGNVATDPVVNLINFFPTFAKLNINNILFLLRVFFSSSNFRRSGTEKKNFFPFRSVAREITKFIRFVCMSSYVK